MLSSVIPGTLCWVCGTHLYPPAAFVRKRNWKLLEMYGKLRRSIAGQLRIKYGYFGILRLSSWNFLLQKKKLESFSIILPWKRKRAGILGKILE